MNLDWRVRDAVWNDDFNLIQTVRYSVFTLEQGVSREIDIDGKDPHCIHFLAETNSGDPIGCARLAPSGRVGRVAVVKKWRRHGIGGKIMNCLINHSELLKMPKTYLHSQLTVVAFYESLGYKSEGSVFNEADIPHVLMVRKANNA